MTSSSCVPDSEAAAIEAAAVYHAAQQALGVYRPDPVVGTEALFSPGFPGIVFGPHRAEAARLWSLHVAVVRAAFALEQALHLHGEPVEFGWWEYRIDFGTGRVLARRRRA